MAGPVSEARRPAVASEPAAAVEIARELRRKRIHVATAVAPLIVWFAPQAWALGALAAAAAVALAVEVARRRLRWARYRFLRSTREMLRDHERVRISGATYLALAFLLAALLLPRPVAVVAMLYGAFGDAAAAIVGRRWGRHRVPGGKSWEGAAAAFGVNSVAGLLVPGIGALAALVGAFGAALLELLPLPLDDNLRVVLGGGGLLWAASLIL